jgi:hypothetical protein
MKQKSDGRIIRALPDKTLTQQADEFFDRLAKTGFGATPSEIILPPGIPPNPIDSPAFATQRSTFFPNDKIGVDFFIKADSAYWIIGSVSYQDSAGTPYRSDYCMMHLGAAL